MIGGTKAAFVICLSHIFGDIEATRRITESSWSADHGPGVFKRMFASAEVHPPPQSDLPYDPDSDIVSRATSSMRGKYDARILMNQNAIYRFLAGSGDEIASLPYTATEKLRKRAHGNRKGARDAMELLFQSAIYDMLANEDSDAAKELQLDDERINYCKNLINNGYVGAWNCMVLLNDFRLMTELRDGDSSALPFEVYPPNDAIEVIEQRAKENREGSWTCRQMMNQITIAYELKRQRRVSSWFKFSVALTSPAEST
eukprot:TRINITY_DN74842_c0_g1_i1.p1 TRINITY_DN74842_c0_g1~~TRINITY_DN74842_c0_g1_i1.p1  ORF type:complete len:276 (+),score=21.14 TRINITY_DN74842_c0_g1_i1:55-828(+)